MFKKTFEFKYLHKLSEKIGQVPTWFLFLAYLLIVSLSSAYFPIWVNIPLLVLVPIFVWFTLKTVMFERLKLGTLIIVRALIIFPVLIPNRFPPRVFLAIVLTFLMINILEATFTDLLKNKQPFNAVTGFVLAFTVLLLGGSWISVMPNSEMAFSFLYRTDLNAFSSNCKPFVESTLMGGGSDYIVGGALAKAHPLLTVGTITWVLAYTIWNWLFVIGEFSPSVAFLHIAILLSPMLCAIVPAIQYQDWTLWAGCWLVFRALTLTTGGVFQISAKKFVEDEFQNKNLADFIKKVKAKKVQAVLMVVNLALMLTSIIIYFTYKI